MDEKVRAGMDFSRFAERKRGAKSLKRTRSRSDFYSLERKVAEAFNRIMSPAERYNAIWDSANEDLQILVELASKNKLFLQQCLSNDLERTWEALWSELNNNPPMQECEHNPSLYHPLKPQPGLHPFYRYAGMDLYDKGKKTDQRTLLVQAAGAPFFNFHAIRALVQHHLTELSAEKENGAAGHIKQLTKLAKSAAKYHHTPGFLLLAKVNLRLATFQRKTSPELLATAYKSLVVARMLEPYCANTIFNAYCGNGIIDSNTWGIGSVEDLHAKLYEICRPILGQKLLNTLYDQAFEIAQEIIRRDFYEHSPQIGLY